MRLSTELEGLALDSCRDMIDKENKEKQQLVMRSETARKELESGASAQREELASHLLSNNNSNEGIITWLKPNVNLVVNPEALHLKECLKYLIEHEEYESNGFLLYDFINEDVDTHYEKIMKILRHEDLSERSVPLTR
jgi:hypothetical protein